MQTNSTTRHFRRCGRFVANSFLFRDRVCARCHRKAYSTRQERDQRLALAGAVQSMSDGIYFVESASAMLEGIRGQGYHVNTRKHTCTCPDYQQHSNDALFEGCQHEWAVKAVQAGLANPAVA